MVGFFYLSIYPRDSVILFDYSFETSNPSLFSISSFWNSLAHLHPRQEIRDSAVDGSGSSVFLHSFSVGDK